jgi:hypothetical protein
LGRKIELAELEYRFNDASRYKDEPIARSSRITGCLRQSRAAVLVVTQSLTGLKLLGASCNIFLKIKLLLQLLLQNQVMLRRRKLDRGLTGAMSEHSSLVERQTIRHDTSRMSGDLTNMVLIATQN